MDSVMNFYELGFTFLFRKNIWRFLYEIANYFFEYLVLAELRIAPLEKNHRNMLNNLNLC